jgi:hypothetical protein
MHETDTVRKEYLPLSAFLFGIYAFIRVQKEVWTFDPCPEAALAEAPTRLDVNTRIAAQNG